MYRHIARFYDTFMMDVDYRDYARYIDCLFRKHMDPPPTSVVDLACGTGLLTVALHDMGYDIIGVDISEDMLSQATAKNRRDILWIQQDICALDLHGTVDAAVCFLDGVNHVTNQRKIKEFFSRIFIFLNGNGILIFDINTRYKFEQELAGNVFYFSGKDLVYLWENDYDKKRGICRMDLTCFVRTEDDRYERYEGTHNQRVYDLSFLREAAEKAGFEWLGVYHDKTLEEVRPDTLRAFVVLKKQKIE